MGVTRLTTPELMELLDDREDVLFLDVRSVQEFEAGHVPGAYNVPLMHMADAGMIPNPSFASEVERAFRKDADIIVSCKAGGRSRAAADVLVKLGYQRVFDHVGGFHGGNGDPGWTAAGGPSTTDVEVGHTYEELKG